MAQSRTTRRAISRKFTTRTSPTMSRVKIINVCRNRPRLQTHRDVLVLLSRDQRKSHLCVNHLHSSNNIRLHVKDPCLAAQIHDRVQSRRCHISHWHSARVHELHQSIWISIKRQQLPVVVASWIIWATVTIVHPQNLHYRPPVYCITRFKHTPRRPPPRLQRQTIGSNINVPIAEEAIAAKTSIEFSFSQRRAFQN